MENVKELLQTSKKYAHLLGKYKYKIVNFLKNDSLDEKQIFDLARQFKDITERYVEKLLKGEYDFNENAINDIYNISKFSIQNCDKRFLSHNMIPFIYISIINKIISSSGKNAGLKEDIDKFERHLNNSKKNQDQLKKHLLSSITYGLDNLKNKKRITSKAIADEIVNSIYKLGYLLEGNYSSILKRLIDLLDSHDVTKEIPYEKVKSVLKKQKEIKKDIDKGSLKDLHKRLYKEINGLEFPTAIKMIKENKDQTLSALSKTLVEKSYTSFISPQRKLRDNKFNKAKKLIYSDNEDEIKNGRNLLLDLCRIYERKKRYASDKFALANEWYSFAESRLGKLMEAYKIWELNFNNGEASSSIKWNLAVAYLKLGQNGKALNVLSNYKDDPYLHLRFATYIAVLIVQKKETDSTDYTLALDFLHDNLIKLPSADCYLAHFTFWIEKNPNKVLNDYEYLLQYFKLSNKEIKIPAPVSRLNSEKITAIQHELIELKLYDTWILWLKDYTKKNYYNTYNWRLLSESYLSIGDIKNAEKALKESIQINISRYKNSSGKNNEERETNFLRKSLINLFEFYNKNGIPLEEGQRACKEYMNKVGELWDFAVNANNRLIRISKKFAPENIQPTRRERENQPNNDNIKGVWNNLHDPLSRVKTLEDFNKIGNRVLEAIAIIKVPTEEQKKEKKFIINTVKSFMTFGNEQVDEDSLVEKFDTFNNNIGVCHNLARNTIAFSMLKSLTSALERVFRHLSEKYNVRNVPLVGAEILGEGIDLESHETSILVPITNSGSGRLSNLTLTCRSKDNIIKEIRPFKIKELAGHASYISVLPIKVNNTNKAELNKCKIFIEYTWTNLKGLKDKKDIIINWFSFHDYLSNYNLQHEFKKIYTDEALKFEKHDQDLFQGREAEIELVTSRFIQNNNYEPIYFHGSRKVGKSSLLNKIESELNNSGLTTIKIDCDGIRPQKEEQTVSHIASTLIYRIIEDAKSKNINIDGLDEIDSNSNNVFIEVEKFFKILRANSGQDRIFLIIDEFHSVVDEKTTELLNLFRRLNNNGVIALILAGLWRPEIILKKAPESNLSPAHHPVDFLDKKAIDKLLNKPVKKYGIKFHNSCVEEIKIQTSGHPFHISQIAQKCINYLNSERRTTIVPFDIERAAIDLSNDDSVFRVSSMSPLIVNDDERKTSIVLAKEIKNFEDGIKFELAEKVCDVDSLIDLQNKYLITNKEGYIRFRGKMLHTYLKGKTIATTEIPAGDQNIPDKKVGIFVDYENISHSDSNEAFDPRKFAEKIVSHYSKMGTIVCRWAAAFSFKHDVRVPLEQANFDLRQESNKKWAKKDAADFILIELVTKEAEHTQPEVFVIVAGDIDYIQKVKTLNENNAVVRICGYKNKSHINQLYFDYQQERERFLKAEGFTDEKMDFFIDDLEEILAEDND